MLHQAAGAIGYSSDMEMRYFLMEKNGGNGIIPILFYNKDGISHTNQHITSGYIVRKCEYAVMFTKRLDQDRTYRSSTVAHEILHLFGAEDLYIPKKRDSIAQTLYEYDIMRGSRSIIGDHTLGTFTAYTLGWTDEIPEICSNLDWYRDIWYYEDFFEENS